MKRFLCLALATALMLSAMAFSGCSKESSKEYPVTIGSVTIKSEPQNIVVLSDNMADIISYIGYDVKMVGRSLECDQSYLAVVPVVGSSDKPSIDSITDFEADLVIADNVLSDKSKKQLEDRDIPVLTMLKAENTDELRTLYTNLGTALGGNITGREKGEKAYEELISTIESFKGTVQNGIVKTSAYLYIEQNGQLCTFKSGSIESKIFGYSGALNIFSNQEEDAVNTSELKMGTPTYIFYDSEEVLDRLRNDEQLSTLSALSSGRVCQIPLKEFYRQGVSYEEIVYKMIDIMFVEHDESTPDEETAVQTVPATIADPVPEADDEISDIDE